MVLEYLNKDDSAGLGKIYLVDWTDNLYNHVNDCHPVESIVQT